MAGNSSHPLAIGDRGRLVIPAEVRERHGWEQGDPLVALDTEAGLVLMDPDSALDWLRSRLSGRDLVAELLADRNAEIARES